MHTPEQTRNIREAERERALAADEAARQGANETLRTENARVARFAGLQQLAPEHADPCGRVELAEDGALYGTPIVEALLRPYASGRAPIPTGYSGRPRDAEIKLAKRRSAMDWRGLAIDVLAMARASAARAQNVARMLAAARRRS